MHLPWVYSIDGLTYRVAARGQRAGSINLDHPLIL